MIVVDQGIPALAARARAVAALRQGNLAIAAEWIMVAPRCFGHFPISFSYFILD